MTGVSQVDTGRVSSFAGSAPSRGVRLLGVVVLVYAMLRLPAPADASSGLTFLQFNMCGRACGTHLTIARDVETAISGHSPRPFVVTLDEVCRSQYDRLVADLRYSGHFEPTVRDRCWDGSDYGIAILLRTGSVDYLGSWPLPSPAGGEPRTLSCVRATLRSQPLVGCVAHLDTDPANTPSQVAAVAARTAGFTADSVVVGGDFNATPDSAAMDPMYGAFDEAEPVRGGEFTGGCVVTRCGSRPGYHHPTRKIDYIFLSRGDFADRAAETTDAPHSDHTLLWATVTPT
jgi:endonuclease/exonuclease/phosphatase family metal-dependent hydrolase